MSAIERGLKLYVWKKVLYDYTPGVMFALAHSPKEARELLKKQCCYLPDEDLQKRPELVTSAKAFYIWGGG